LSPLNASATPRHGSRSASSNALLGSSTRKRVPTPHPKRNTREDDDDDDEFLQEAAKSIPYEYTSALATYLVRRPYISSLEEMWASRDYQPDINKPPTLEVAATITADASILTLSGVSTVRHKNAATQQWKVYQDVDDMDKPLGCVMYIDSDANEKEYWLGEYWCVWVSLLLPRKSLFLTLLFHYILVDAIYEEAFAAREAYCASLISAAAVLQARKAQDPPMNSGGGFAPQQTLETVEKPRPLLVDACVGTEDFDGGEKEQQVAPASKPAAKSEAAETSKPPPKELVEESSSGDILSVFVGMIFSSLVGLVWLVLVRIPFKIFTFTLLVVTASAFLSIIWLYLADDHGAQLMGAGMQYGFNKPGIV